MSAQMVDMESQLWRSTQDRVSREMRLARKASRLLHTPGFIETLETESTVESAGESPSVVLAAYLG